MKSQWHNSLKYTFFMLLHCSFATLFQFLVKIFSHIKNSCVWLIASTWECVHMSCTYFTHMCIIWIWKQCSNNIFGECSFSLSNLQKYHAHFCFINKLSLSNIYIQINGFKTEDNHFIADTKSMTPSLKIVRCTCQQQNMNVSALSKSTPWPL